MYPFARIFRQHRLWLAAALLVTLGSLAALSVAPVEASDPQVDDSQLAQLGNSQIFSDDLEVEEGEVIRTNVVLYDGDAKFKDGGRIEGNLVL